MKLVLLHRRGIDPADLLAAQRAVITPVVAAIDGERRGRDGVDSLLLWRYAGAMPMISAPIPGSCRWTKTSSTPPLPPGCQ